MKKCLIGASGFVGSTLLRQTGFDALYRSSNAAELRGVSVDTAVCAAAPAQKWIANREPEADLQNIERLMGHLDGMRCNKFILISTVDVFATPVGADEETPVEEEGLHPYGAHRRLLEKFVQHRFPDHLIVRLPGLVGPGLRKNVIFDLLNDNNLDAIDSRGVFQFYPMINLWYDMRTAVGAGLKLVHLTAEPVSVAELSEEGFGRPFCHLLDRAPAVYDFRSRHAALFGGHGQYQYSKRDSIQAVRAYAQSEPVSVAGGRG